MIGLLPSFGANKPAGWTYEQSPVSELTVERIAYAAIPNQIRSRATQPPFAPPWQSPVEILRVLTTGLKRGTMVTDNPKALARRREDG